MWQIYEGIRDLNFSAVGAKLNQNALYLDKNYKQRHGVETVSQIREFMTKLPELQTEHKNLSNRNTLPPLKKLQCILI